MEPNLTDRVITGWGVVSSLGIGKEAFGRHLINRKVPDSLRLDAFSAADYVGRKGTRLYDRITQFAVVAAHETIHGASREPVAGAETGFVLGSTFGGLRSNCDFIRSIQQEKPHLIDGSAFPSTVMNYAAGQVAIRFGLTGPNATLSGGRLASLQALHYADRCIRSGQAGRLLAGGAEEWSEQLEWGFRSVYGKSPRLGEGSAVILLETLESAMQHHREPLVRYLGCSIRLLPRYFDRDHADFFISGLAGCISNVLERSGVEPTAEQVIVLHSTRSDEELGHVEEQAVREAIGGPVKHVRIKELVGECYSASGMFQVAAYLAMIENRCEDLPRYALVLSVESNGMMGCALVSRWIA